MVFIESAFLGDEQGMRNVTKVLNDKIIGTSINVPVNDQLIPPFEVVENTKLSTPEERVIRQQAEKACGGADQQCVEAKMSELSQIALNAKTTASNSSANVIKGRRLTVNVLDDQGNRRRVVVPDGHDFKIDGLSPLDPRKPDQSVPDFNYFKGQFIEFSATAVITFVWVFGIVATFALFARAGFGYIAWALAGVAFLLPGSGYVMIFLYFILKSFVDNYTTMV
jgi:hypothetical protein